MKALIVVADGVQDVEFIYPRYRLEEADYEVAIAAPGDGPCTGIGGTKIVPNTSIGNLGRCDLLILPGGVKAMEKLRLDQSLLSFIRDYHKAGGIIGSMCSGAQLLISAGLVRGRQVSAYYAMQVDIENAGGTFVDAPAVVFDRIVSSPHYKYLGQWMKAVLGAVEKERTHADDAHY